MHREAPPRHIDLAIGTQQIEERQILREFSVQPVTKDLTNRGPYTIHKYTIASLNSNARCPLHSITLRLTAVALKVPAHAGRG